MAAHLLPEICRLLSKTASDGVGQRWQKAHQNFKEDYLLAALDRSIHPRHMANRHLKGLSNSKLLRTSSDILSKMAFEITLQRSRSLAQPGDDIDSARDRWMDVLIFVRSL